MTQSGTALKRLSDGLFLLAVVLLVLAVVSGHVVLYVLAAVLLVASFVATSVKRKRFRAAKAANS